MPFDVFQLAFVQRGLAEVLLLSVAAGLVGTWIVLRGLAFYSHAVGTAAFPGLVLADGVGFAPPLGAAGAAAVLAGTVALLGGRRRTGDDSLTALALTGCLALGVILASDVFHSAASVEQLLFGSLLVIDTPDLVLAAVASAATLAASWIVGQRWAARGFDPDAARTMGLRSRVPDLVLLGVIALGAIAALSAIGALLATAHLRRAGRHGAALGPPARRLAGPLGGARRARGGRRTLALGGAERAARADHRGDRRRGLRPRPPRPPPAAGRPAGRASRGRRSPRRTRAPRRLRDRRERRGQARRRGDHDRSSGTSSGRRRPARGRPPDPPPEHRPPRVRAAPLDVAAAAGARRWSS